jgi:hypothetical protein
LYRSLGLFVFQNIDPGASTYDVKLKGDEGGPKALNDISTRHVVGLYWVPGHAGIRGNEIADELARGAPFEVFWGRSLPWGSPDE